VIRRPSAARRFVAPATAALAVAMSGCVTVPEFRALQRDVEEMQVSGTTGSSGMQGVTDARLAEMGARVDAFEVEISRLRGAVEEAQHAAEEARRAAQEATEAAEALRHERKVPVEPEAAAAPGGAAASGLSQEVRDYQRAFALYSEGSFPEAIDQFRAFLQNYPSSGYSDNALFWIGECQFKLGEYERAVLTFEDVVRRYPDGNKVPDALYRQGVALLEIGRRNGEEKDYYPAAREIFQRILTEYPESERTTEARTQLEKLPL
jgi:tol-pal system protein YbgF